MANWTKRNWANKTLERLGIVGAGQNPASEDTDLLEEIIDSFQPQLRKDGEFPFSVEAIPDWAQQPLSKMLAEQAADHFGFTGQRRQQIRESARIGRKELERQLAGPSTVRPTRTKYH